MESENHPTDQSESGPRQNGLGLKDLNRRHLSSIDKWYRMCAGAGSEITAFEDGTIYLAISVDERQQSPFHEIVGKIARSWFHEEELKHASQYVAVIFRSDGRLGALVDANTSTPPELAHRLVKMMRPATTPDVPIAVVQGRFENDA